jgi:hypothetical protein
MADMTFLNGSQSWAKYSIHGWISKGGTFLNGSQSWAKYSIHGWISKGGTSLDDWQGPGTELEPLKRGTKATFFSNGGTRIKK